MVHCIAPGCCENFTKGHILKIQFPINDPLRCQIWRERARVGDLISIRYLYLCEKHFDPTQWELGAPDCRRKLKPTAVPTVFCVEHPTDDNPIEMEHSYCVFGYKQLYDVQPVESNTYSEFEHIDVEESHVANFASEFENMEVESSDAEMITPEIYSDFNIDTHSNVVDENESATMNDSLKDPLAISEDDLVNAANVTPHFQHSRKCLFVQKSTKYMANIDQGLISQPIIESNTPKLKVKSIQDLMDSKTKGTVKTPQNVFIHKKNIAILKDLQKKLKSTSSLKPPSFNNLPITAKVQNIILEKESSGSGVSQIVPTGPPPLTPSPHFLNTVIQQINNTLQGSFHPDKNNTLQGSLHPDKKCIPLIGNNHVKQIINKSFLHPPFINKKQETNQSQFMKYQMQAFLAHVNKNDVNIKCAMCGESFPTLMAFEFHLEHTCNDRHNTSADTETTGDSIPTSVDSSLNQDQTTNQSENMVNEATIENCQTGNSDKDEERLTSLEDLKLKSSFVRLYKIDVDLEMKKLKQTSQKPKRKKEEARGEEKMNSSKITDSDLKFECFYCDKRFLKNYILLRHIAKDHKDKEEKPFTCGRNGCNMTYTSERQRDKHSKTCF